jgi:hypothetical protein
MTVDVPVFLSRWRAWLADGSKLLTPLEDLQPLFPDNGGLRLKDLSARFKDVSLRRKDRRGRCLQCSKDVRNGHQASPALNLKSVTPKSFGEAQKGAPTHK